MTWVGATLLGAIGWKVGHYGGLFGAVVLSAIGTGYGFYWGRKLYDDNLAD